MSRFWDKSKPPTGPFALNQDCQQAQGLIAWYPMVYGASAKNTVYDRFDSKHLAGVDINSSIAHDGSKTAVCNGTSSRLTYDAALTANVTPISYGFKLRPFVVNTSNYGVASHGQFSGSSNRHQIDIYNGSLRVIDIGSATVTASISGVTANRDHTLLAVFASSTSRTAYLDGVASTTATTSCTHGTAFDKFIIGTLGISSAYANYVNAEFTEVCAWEKELTAEEAAYVAHIANKYELWYPLRSKKWISLAGAQALTPSLFTNTNTFFSPTVSRGAVTLTSSLFTNTNTFYSPTVTSSYSLTPSLFTNTNTFFSPSVTTGAVTLTPSLFTNTNTFFSPTVSLVSGDQNLTPSLFTNTNVFYSPTVTTGVVSLTPSLFTNTNTFFNATVTSSYNLTPALFTNTSTFYAPTVSVGAVTLTPALFTNTNTFFSPEVTQSNFNQTLAPDLFTNGSIFFTHTITGGETNQGGGYIPGTLRERKELGTGTLKEKKKKKKEIEKLLDKAEEIIDVIEDKPIKYSGYVDTIRAIESDIALLKDSMTAKQKTEAVNVEHQLEVMRRKQIIIRMLLL